MITSKRLREIWDSRTYGDIPKDTMTKDEINVINRRWAQMPGSNCWMDAFHDVWRTVDPFGHHVLFGGTFYESLETMAADDKDESATPNKG
jgi:hypothetical protein